MAPVSVPPESPQLAALLPAATQLFREKDSYAVIELLEQQEPRLAAAAYAQLQLNFYWQHKDLPAVIAISRAGIQFALSAATRAGTPAEAQALRGQAKALAYNLASFTWPGWGEEGVAISQSLMRIGHDAARLNLRLTGELKRPDDAWARALWTFGAHELSAGRYPSAREAFARGHSHAAKSPDKALALLLEGYVALVDALTNPDPGARTSFDKILKALEADAGGDGRDYASQLSVAFAIFRHLRG